VKPDYIIETGTQFGGTTFFFAHLLDLLGHGEVITIDIIDRMAPEVKAHPRVIQIVGSSTSTQTVEKIRRIVKNGRTLVDLDSEHTTDHVLRELELYSPFVSVGSYIIVEDTMFDTFYHHEGYPSGPLKAVEEFLRKNDNFEIDTSKEKLLITWNPKGYLKRKK
jgi:cephalosporin hydroxylase